MAQKYLSRIEELTREYCKIILSEYDVIYNYRPDWLKSPLTGKNLELDFYFDELDLGIEVNGFFHYKDKRTKERDLLKKTMCEGRGITLLYIWRKQDLLGLRKTLINIYKIELPEIPFQLKCKIKKYQGKKGNFRFEKISKSTKKKKGYRYAKKLQTEETESIKRIKERKGQEIYKSHQKRYYK